MDRGSTVHNYSDITPFRLEVESGSQTTGGGPRRPCFDTMASDGHKLLEGGKAAIEDLCSTDSGTSYTSSTSGTSDKRPPPPPADDPRNTNLNFFHDFATIEDSIVSGSFTKCKQLSKCCRGEGSIELHQMKSGESEQFVVVKKLPVDRVNINKGKPASEQALLLRHASRDAEDPLAEIGVFGYLQRHCEKIPEYILEMLVAFRQDEDVWLVLEHADGGDLFGMISSHRPTKDLILLWSWQLLQAVAFLHQQGICHRDISLENILLSGGNIRLMDFGQAVCSQSSGQLLRYFLATGKPYYRPPETYIPGCRKLQVVVPPGISPGQVALAYTPGQDRRTDIGEG
eukprot:Skav205905  [mRNA]  locus=scaffold123:408432:411273:+ [translate_table: standard]